jgi:predicted double-glycine peptidase
MPARIAALIVLLGAAVCASTDRGYWLDIPFVRQPVEGCGAASVSMVVQYWDRQQGRVQKSSDVNQIQQVLAARQGDSIRHEGALASVLQGYLEDQGFTTYIFHGDMALLTHHIQRGRPLIVALEPARGKQLHYVVVAGIEPDQNLVLLNDPAQRKLLKVASRDFAKEWQATGNWTLLAVPRSTAH